MTSYVKLLEAEETVEAQTRLENIDSLINKIVQYEEETEEASLDGLLEDIALIADIDTVSDDSNQVLLMTLHSAKGLEFPYVYMCGMEENTSYSELIALRTSSEVLYASCGRLS